MNLLLDFTRLESQLGLFVVELLELSGELSDPVLELCDASCLGTGSLIQDDEVVPRHVRLVLVLEVDPLSCLQKTAKLLLRLHVMG
jgi:hypothetical protein